MSIRRLLRGLSLLALAAAFAFAAITGCEAESVEATGTPTATDAGARPRPPDLGGGDGDSEECTPADAADVVVPEPYAGRTSPVAATADVLEAGRARFQKSCASCHGSRGDGKGQSGAFGPKPADLTQAIRPEDYLFWRISSGGQSPPFCSAMPGFSGALNESARWELVAYVRSLAQTADAASTD